MVVSWEAPGSDGGSRIRGYKVQWKSGSDDYGSARQRFVLFDSYASVRPAKVSETVSGLTDGTEYTFRVFAFNQNGDGAGAEVVATPSATDAAAPELLTATVTRENLVLNYNEALDETSSPAESAYTVTVAGNARSVSDVSVAESAVTLVLSSKVAKGEAVTVSYTVPTDANDPRIKDATGNDAAAFSGQAVTNNTPPVSTDATLDSISYSSAFQPCENDRRIHCRMEDLGPISPVSRWTSIQLPIRLPSGRIPPTTRPRLLTIPRMLTRKPMGISCHCPPARI